MTSTSLPLPSPRRTAKASTLTPSMPEYWDRPPVGRLGKWFITRKRGTPDELRRWQAWAEWTRHETLLEKARAGLTTMIAPLAFAKDARATLQTYSRRVEAEYGVPRWRQARHLLQMWVRHGMQPIAYYRFQLFRPERWARAGDYLEFRQAERLLRLLLRNMRAEADAPAFNDKRAFEDWTRQHRLPSVATILEVDGGRIVRGDPDALPAADIFVKPANWICGKGTSRWRYVADGDARCYVNTQGDRRSAAELIADVTAESAAVGRPFLVQPCITNHRDLQPLTPGALCTVRIITAKHSDADPFPLLAVYRMATGAAPADNFDLGGIAAPIDLETGVLSAAIQKRGLYPVTSVEHHPDTGARIVGVVVPEWRACLDLVVRAHRVARTPLPVIGWDVAVTPDGPMLIEANDVPCSVLAQMPSGMPLGATAFPSCLSSHLRRAFAA